MRLSAGDTALLSSSVLENTRNPRWDQDFRVNVCCAESELLMKVREVIISFTYSNKNNENLRDFVENHIALVLFMLLTSL